MDQGKIIFLIFLMCSNEPNVSAGRKFSFSLFGSLLYAFNKKGVVPPEPERSSFSMVFSMLRENQFCKILMCNF